MLLPQNARFIQFWSLSGWTNTALPGRAGGRAGGRRAGGRATVRFRGLWLMIRVWVRVRIWDRVRVTVRVIVTLRVRVSKKLGSA